MSAQPKATQQLANKKYLVLGGSSGIGFGVASALIEETATVVIASSSADRVNATVKQLSDPSNQYNADPKRVSGHTINLKGEDVEKNLEELFSKVGKIDGLIHTAGDAVATKPLEEQDYNFIIEAGQVGREERENKLDFLSHSHTSTFLDSPLQVRFISAILSAKVAKKYLNPGGSIIFTSGSVSLKPRPDWATVVSIAKGQTSFCFLSSRHGTKLRRTYPLVNFHVIYHRMAMLLD